MEAVKPKLISFAFEINRESGCLLMKQSLHYTLLLFVLLVLVQCSSVKRSSVAPIHAGEETVLPDTTRTVVPTEALPDTTKLIIAADSTILTSDSLNQVKTVVLDSLKKTTDSTTIALDSTKTTLDSTAIAVPEKLTAPVIYSAKDSIVFTKGNMGYLYGDADVKYGKLGIKGEYITMDMDSSTIMSTFGLDSLGKEFGYPVFTEGESQYEMKKVRYNFESGKAFISNVVTQQGEGYIVANTAKKNKDNSFYMVDAKYTTCDLHDHPHFFINLSRAKVRPEKDIVTGPAWLVVADVPVFPVFLPFAFFPFTKSYSSGIIMPSYGDEMNRGFYLSNGGYYFAINDYVDLALTGEIYTKGTWGVSARSNYRKRYKFSGSVNASYLTTVLGDKGLPDYSVSKDLRLSWTHAQDPKSNMYRTLSASVNFSTSQHNHNNLSDVYSGRFAQNTKSSSVNLTQRFPDSPWNISASVNVNQVSQDSTISATLPNVSVSMNSIRPFQRKNAVGEERWYEKISVSYSGEFRSTITSKENRILKASYAKDWKHEIRHSIPVSATFTLFKNIQVTPSFNYSERWHTSSTKEAWNPVTKRHEKVDTISTFKRTYDYNTALSFQTKLYGMYVPWKMFGDKIQAIRHVFSPSISLNYHPDFTDPRYKFMESYNYVDENGDEMTYRYSPYANSNPSGKNGSISFNFKNNLEMKVRSTEDSSGYKKIILIDNLDIGINYNMMADSLKWSDLTTNLSLKIGSYSPSLQLTWETYMYGLNKSGSPVKINKLRILNGKGFGRLRNVGFSVPTIDINQDTFGKWFGKKEKDSKDDDKKGGDIGGAGADDGVMGANPHETAAKKSVFDQGDQSMGEFDDDGYLKNRMQWSLSVNYTPTFGYGDFNKEKMEFDYRLTHNLSARATFQPTKNWNFTFDTNYNFDIKRFTALNCSLTRNLHCWSMSAQFIPFGPYQSYNFVIRANASLLQDLKYEQRSTQYDRGPNWY